ncbi:C4-dicarboxylate TRAP transporter substrate-binding protein [Phyllobacterium sp. 21LDTY02-6]|uniref:C4-dicarboxylate TRAP transporter substrate-binding protein n=1 Tax=unclassified Phyllobacterium TaxID=2638441 RepID=UPI0020221A36|nr:MULTISPECIES: C4-dicarboxylate TRAP transporter substrate-binding protein [unclassified Phyllobacterium]MCO4319071.1 C4-dicarboxylate TRAP transporter substrate-binding protein [Phyllobacterium sp. 21LDTY02-6]MCX8279043.1 C4-dicarboxylate TRAP transporter substrate-binding protein [Phyllobacterium sp. 0TCS1.6C]MCX8293827.1 C4-dicarboxylate TRAP transporter substrate-binding protein [Phyllobacterium sp. 0TCS1.6A]
MSVKNCIAATLCVGALALMSTGQALAQEYVLRLNHVHTPAEAYHQGFQKWADRVFERTKGGLKIEVFHSAQLGVEEDIIEQIRMGANVGQNTDAARLGNYVPEIAVLNGPYLVKSFDEAFKLAELPVVQGWIDKLATQHGLKVVCFDFSQGLRHVFTNQPVRNPQDLSGLRIRTPPAPIWQEATRALGAAPTAMAFGEIYPGLQQRAIDGAEVTYANIRPNNLQEVVSHVSETGHILLLNFEVVSTTWFETLPPEFQTALVEECRVAGQETTKVLQAQAETEKAALIEAGMTVVDNVNLEAFRAASEQAYKALNLTDVRDALYKELGR